MPKPAEMLAWRKLKSLEDKEPITWAVFQGHTGNGVEGASPHHAVGFLVDKKLLRNGEFFLKK